MDATHRGQETAGDAVTAPSLVFAPSIPRTSARSGGYPADLALLVIGGSALLIAIVLWFDNAQGGLTGNGVFKSLELKPWVRRSGQRAALSRRTTCSTRSTARSAALLDLLGVFAGDPRRQITILNAVSCSLCLAVVYLLIRAVTATAPWRCWRLPSTSPRAS